MKSSFTMGRILAFLSATLFAFFASGYVFAPGGLAANAVIFIALGIFVIIQSTMHFGPMIDDLLFHKGSRERALALREIERVAIALSKDLQECKSKGNRSEKEANAMDACNRALQELFATVYAIRAQPAGDPKNVASQIKQAKAAELKAKECAQAVFGQSPVRKDIFSGWKSLTVALAAAIALRIFIIEPYQIPSGSMIPTLLVGDHLFVSKLQYGIMNPFPSFPNFLNPFSRDPSYLIRWGTPQPGEVVIFQAPDYVGSNAGATWIKRVIAGPGQRVRLSDTTVYVDDKPYSHVIPEETVDYMDFEGAGSQGIFSGNQGQWEELQAVHTIEQIGDVKHDIYNNPFGRRSSIETNWGRPARNRGFDGSYPGLDCGPKDCKIKEGFVFVMGDNRGRSSDGRVWGALPIENIKGKALFIWVSIDGNSQSIFSLPGFRWSRSFKGIN